MLRLGVAFGLLLSAVVLHAGQESLAFRTTAETVPIFVTVQDQDGRLVTALTRDAFQVLDDGRPQPIVVFDNTPRPLQLIVLIDLSGSMDGSLALLREAARQLFARLGEDDVAKVGTFAREIAIGPEFTRDVELLTAALPPAIEPNAPTPLWQAVREALSAFEPSHRRRVVLVLSDGRDSSAVDRRGQFVNPIEVGEGALRDNVMVYGVRIPPLPGSLQEQIIQTRPDPWLARVTRDSGGGFVELRRLADLNVAFARVVEELRSQYLLGFTPAARDGKAHRIEIRLTQRDLEARARRGYQAPEEAAK
jgi:Ca-activated chloride channel family protein